jgi:hypothetical protein
MYIDRIKEYLAFLKSCEIKKYNDTLVTHNHHVFPISIYGKNKTTVKLSVEDHIIAHLLLAECFEEGSSERSKNLKSARLLNKKSVKDKKTLDKISEGYKGDNNPFYGKKHTVETIKKIANINSKRTKGKTYEDLYGDRAKDERMKRSKGAEIVYQKVDRDERDRRCKTRSDRLKKLGSWIGEKNPMKNPKVAKKVADKQTGKNHHSAKSVQQYSLSGNLIAEFDTIQEAYEKTGVNPSSIVQVCKNKAKTAGKYKWQYKI